MGNSLPAPVEAGSPSSIEVTIVDDDTAAVSLSAAPNPVPEGESVTVTAELSVALSDTVTIPLRVRRGTSERGDHSTIVAGITIAAGATNGTGTISTAQDADIDDETFTVALGGSLPSLVEAGTPSSVEITITDDDTAPPTTLTLHAAPAPAEGGGPVRLTARLDLAAPAGGTTVRLVLSGTATEGARGDYTLSSKTLEIGAGARAATATLSVIDDATDDDGETVVIEAASSNPALSALPLTLTIADNDAVPGTPRGLALAAGDGSLTARWTAPVDPGSSAIVRYEVQHREAGAAWPVAVAEVAGTRHTLSGLENGVRYEVRVRAVNGAGAGAWSGPEAGTPKAVFDAAMGPWLGRFGRTVTGQVLDAVAVRQAAARTPGARAALAGHALAEWTSDAALAVDPGLRSGVGGASEAGAGANTEGALLASARGRSWLASPDSMSSDTVTLRELVTGSAFAVTGEETAGGGGRVAVWGRGVHGRFDGRETELSLDGEVTTGLLGADWASGTGAESGAGRWSAGLAVGYSHGEGGWRRGDSKGGVKATLFGFYPYAGLALTDWLSVWAAVGGGVGEVTAESPLRADLALAMGAAGMRGEVVRPPADGNGLSLAVMGDARYALVSSAAVRAAAGEDGADVWLVRTGVEGSYRSRLSRARR